MEQLTRTHILYDVWVHDATLLNQLDFWRDMLVTAAQGSGATILAKRFHQFTPHGITGFLLLAESHISVHTWPEEKLATVDIFTCGPMNTNFIINQLRDHLNPSQEQVTTIDRGVQK